MSKKKIPIQIIRSSFAQENVIFLGERLVKLWKIPTGRPLQLAFGSFKQEIIVNTVAKLSTLRISQTLADRIGLPANTVLRFKYSASSRTLRIGPLISVLISRDYPEVPDKPFGSISMFCYELVKACQKQGAHVYFFTPDHITSNPGQVQGWIYDEGWRRTTMPCADVVNNRLTSRKLENKPSVQHFMKEVKSLYGTHVFNEKFLDKNEVFDALRSDVSLHRYMPESHLLTGFKVLKQMCSQYPVVFLKPVRGSLGKGIIRVSRLPDGGYQALSTTVGGTRKQVYPNLTKLFNAISGKMKSTKYQIQQGLTLIECGKRPVDFRALVQKNTTGAWSITSIVARIAGSNHYVSNLARGGSLSPVMDAVNKSSLTSAAKSTANLKLQRAALEIAKGIEKCIPAHFGELGIDLAMDQTGRVWLLEVNSKPSKNDNTPLNEQKIRPSVRQLVQYCGYLTGL